MITDIPNAQLALSALRTDTYIDLGLVDFSFKKTVGAGGNLINALDSAGYPVTDFEFADGTSDANVTTIDQALQTIFSGISPTILPLIEDH